MEEDVNNNVIGDPDPNDHVRLAIISSNFDRALNSMYQLRSEVNGAALLDLLGKMLQINHSIDTDLTCTFNVLIFPEVMAVIEN